MSKSLRVEGSKDFDPRYHNKATQKWIEVLESGYYPQGRGALYRGGRYCCLGVAVKVTDNGRFVDNHTLSNRQYSALDLNSGSGIAANSNRSLVVLNDEEQKTFPEIAAILRNEPQNYFKGTG